jgi:hypothetical protein
VDGFLVYAGPMQPRRAAAVGLYITGEILPVISRYGD